MAGTLICFSSPSGRNDSPVLHSAVSMVPSAGDAVGGLRGEDAAGVGFGRDHPPSGFTRWLAGGGIERGFTYGKTDAFSYNIVEDPVHVHDPHATVLHCLGIDHARLT
jgi:hypothetical protein